MELSRENPYKNFSAVNQIRGNTQTQIGEDLILVLNCQNTKEDHQGIQGQGDAFKMTLNHQARKLDIKDDNLILNDSNSGGFKINQEAREAYIMDHQDTSQFNNSSEKIRKKSTNDGERSRHSS